MDDEFINRLNMAAPQFFLHEPFGFRFEFDGYTFNLTRKGGK